MSGFLIVNLTFFSLGGICTAFWYGRGDFEESGPEMDTEGRYLGLGRGADGRGLEI